MESRLEHNAREAVRDYHNYNSRQLSCFVIPAVLTFVAILTFIARAFTRIRLVKRFGAEDWACLVALCASIVLSALIFAETYYGNGVHIDQINPYSAMMMFRLFYVSVWIYNISLSMTKISILLQYQRLFVVSSARIACWIVLAATVIFGLWSVLGNIFLCKPVAYWWNKSLDGHCLDERSVWLSNSIVNMATDIIIVIIPIPVVSRLCISLKQKMSLTLLFVLGGFGCITSGLRVRSVVVIAQSEDVTWDNAPAAIWSSIEVNVAIICACLATLKPLLTRYAPKILGATLSISEATRVSEGGSVSMPTQPLSTASPIAPRAGGNVFGSFTFGMEDHDTTPNKKLRLRSMSFSEQDGSRPTTPKKNIFGSFSLRRGSALSNKRRSSGYPQSPVDVELGRQVIPEEGTNTEDGRPDTATPSTMVTDFSSGKKESLMEMHSYGVESEEDLYHAMLRTQTRDSRRGGSVSSPGGRRPSTVAFKPEPQYDEEAKRRRT